MTSEYTEQDRANEGCCWDYVRQLCRGGGCLCDCHAKTEQILLADRSKWRREATRLQALVSEQAQEIERLRARAERSEAVLRNLADAAAPFAKRMKQAVEHQEKWRADHPGQMAPLLNSEPIPSHWNYTPMVGEARRLVAALAAASEGEG